MSKQFDVIVIADSLMAGTLHALKSLPIIVIEAAFDKSTKVNSLNKAFEKVGNDYDYAMILDADNVMIDIHPRR